MTEQSILFSAPMIKALMEGRKTQTRRLRWRKPSRKLLADISRLSGGTADEVTGRPSVWQSLRPGDRVWVRENWKPVPATAYRCSVGVQQTPNPNDPDIVAVYAAGWDRSTGGAPWRPSIHMPRWASRMTLLLTDVRVQRLQDITTADLYAEGAITDEWLEWREDVGNIGKPEGSRIEDERDVFERLWNSLHKPPHDWEANPEVVALSFTVERKAQP